MFLFLWVMVTLFSLKVLDTLSLLSCSDEKLFDEMKSRHNSIVANRWILPLNLVIRVSFFFWSAYLVRQSYV